MFKPGDKVKCVKLEREYELWPNGNGHYKETRPVIGRIYTVKTPAAIRTFHTEETYYNQRLHSEVNYRFAEADFVVIKDEFGALLVELDTL